MTSRRQIKVFLDGKQVTSEMKNIFKAKGQIVNQLRGMVEGTAEYKEKLKELEPLNRVINKHRQNLRGVSSTYDKLKMGVGRFVGVAAGAFAVSEIVHYGRELLVTATQMDSLGQKAQTVFGQALPLVTREAERNAAAMGLTNQQYIEAATNIGDLLIPMGFQREEAANISNELVGLSGALSEWTGGQLKSEEVARILSKALLGEREELKQLGISISEADVKARLAQKGLESLTGEMLQQAKAAATLELVTEKSLDAQTAFAENSDSLVRKQAELTARINTIVERLSIALIPVFSRLVDVAGNVVSGFETVSQLFGGVSAKADMATKSFDQQAKKVQNLEQGLVPLLNRYDELNEKTDKSEEEQAELKEIINKVAETVPSAVTEFNKYGEALDINSGKAREFVKVQQLLLAEKNREAIQAQQDKLSDLKEEYDGLSNVVTETDGAFQKFFKQDGEFFERVIKGGKNTRTELRKLSEEEVAQLVNRFGQLADRIEGTQAVIKELSGQPLVDLPPTQDGGNGGGETSPTADEIAAQKAAAERLRQQRIKQLEDLAATLESFREAERLSELSEDEQKLERLRIQYQKEIDLAKQLEAQGVQEATGIRIELEKMRDQELSALRLELHQKRMDEESALRAEQEAQEIQAEIAQAERKAAVIQELNEYARQAVLTERELAIQELEQYYNELVAKAEQYQIDTTDITIQYQRERARINEEYRDKEQQEQTAANLAQLDAMQRAFASFAGLVSSSIEFVSGKASEQTALGKLLALIEIGSQSAIAISTMTAKGAAAGPFPANLAAIATGVGTVLTNINQARKVLADTPSVPQRYTGGWWDVIGQDDGRTYNAKFIGQQSTGPLPAHPVLLASERGPEYLISHEDIQKPAVLNHVRAIENIRRYGTHTSVPQFAEGGFTATPPPSDPSTIDITSSGGITMPAEMMMVFTELLGVLTELKENGIDAYISDDTAVAMQKKLNEIERAAGR